MATEALKKMPTGCQHFGWQSIDNQNVSNELCFLCFAIDVRGWMRIDVLSQTTALEGLNRE